MTARAPATAVGEVIAGPAGVDETGAEVPPSVPALAPAGSARSPAQRPGIAHRMAVRARTMHSLPGYLRLRGELSGSRAPRYGL